MNWKPLKNFNKELGNNAGTTSETVFMIKRNIYEVLLTQVFKPSFYVEITF